MDLDITKEQQILKDSARSFLKKECPRSLLKVMKDDERGYPQELWDKMATLGWMGVMIPEQYGGIGGTFLDLAILLEAMGEACMPGPFFTTVVLGGSAILLAGSEAQKQEYLPRIASGELVLAFAVMEPDAWYEASGITTRAVDMNNEYVINGTKLFVENAHIADFIICAARTDETLGPDGGLTLFMVEGKNPGVRTTLLKTLAYDKQCEVVFDGVRVPKRNVLGNVNQAAGVLEAIQMQAAVAKCAEMVGALQATLDMTVSYAKERIQFDRPIGSFQAVQHHCANMVIDVNGTRFITYQAAWKIAEGLDSSLEAAMAKAWTSAAGRRVTLLGHQIHGAISFCEEHDMHLYYRRAKAAEIAFGDGDYHLKKVARGLGL